jgi:methionyl-tRNA formyltransferase
MRVVFLGNAPWSVPSLEALAESPHRPALVLTRSARPAGRGSKPQRTHVAETAERLELPMIEVDTVKSGPGFEALVEAKPEVLVVVAYGEILPKTILDVPSVAPVNVHFSMLPELRGAAPVQRSILDGLARTGVTIIRMDEGVDTGPILRQAEERIRTEDDSGSLGERLARLGGSLLAKTLDRLERGGIEELTQDDSRATYAKKLTPEDRVIDWNEVADRVVRRVRALAPDPVAETLFRDRVLKVFRASRADPDQTLGDDFRPGEIIVGPDGELIVGTASWPVVLEEVQPEAKRRMTGMEFVRGYRPKDGEILG